MCGIAGIFGRKDPQTLNNMLKQLVHRGPDDEFSVNRDNFSLGARRLSIQDVPGGRQPVSNETETVWAAQNGEIYNFPELQKQLMELGHSLHSHCDTEVLPHLYEEYREELVQHVDGMFALAIWDADAKIGVLARDRMGKKPLYYHQRGKDLYFASEIKSLLTIPGFERQLNLEALYHFLSYKHVPHPLTIFKGIQILPPAHLLTYQGDGAIAVRPYWKLDFSTRAASAAIAEEDAVEQLLALLKQGVKRRFLSDVPIGFFLSGGIDSSLSTALAAELSGEKIKTFTLTYSHDSTTEGKQQDQQWARWVAQRYETEHYEEEIEFANFPENLRRILGCFDEPFAGVVSTYFLSQLISRHVKVAVSGDGADELFGSYLSHRLAFPLANYEQYQQTGDSSLIHPFEAQPEFLTRLFEPDDWAWRSKLCVYSDEENANLYAEDVALAMNGFSTRDHWRDIFSKLTAVDPLNRILEAEFKTIFADQVLTFVDRLSMAHSLEVRTAFLDTDFVSFVASLPGSLKIHNGETKYLLKKAAMRYFPEEMVLRKKEGFLMPVAQWLLCDLEDYVRQTLSPENLGKHGIFNADRVCEYVDRFYQSKGDHLYANKLFSLIVFQEWYELYMV